MAVILFLAASLQQAAVVAQPEPQDLVEVLVGADNLALALVAQHLLLVKDTQEGMVLQQLLAEVVDQLLLGLMP